MDEPDVPRVRYREIIHRLDNPEDYVNPDNLKVEWVPCETEQPDDCEFFNTLTHEEFDGVWMHRV